MAGSRSGARGKKGKSGRKTSAEAAAVSASRRGSCAEVVAPAAEAVRLPLTTQRKKAESIMPPKARRSAPPPACCESCAAPAAPLRRCTRQRLCAECRALPEYRIVTRKIVLRDSELSPEELDDNLEAAGSYRNVYDARFAPTRVYFWKDVFQLLLDLDRPIPDEW